jgi:hypothetical protein
MENTKIYRSGEDTIEVKSGKIVSASTDYFRAGPHFQIGSKITAKILGDFGYRLIKTPAQYDAWGRKVGR